MQHTAPDLQVRAHAALRAAVDDPIVDGLVGWYAMEARHLAAGSGAHLDLDQLVGALTGATTADAHLYAGHTAGVLAAAGVLRATAAARSEAA